MKEGEAAPVYEAGRAGVRDDHSRRPTVVISGGCSARLNPATWATRNGP